MLSSGLYKIASEPYPFHEMDSTFSTINANIQQITLDKSFKNKVMITKDPSIGQQILKIQNPSQAEKSVERCNFEGENVQRFNELCQNHISLFNKLAVEAKGTKETYNLPPYQSNDLILQYMEGSAILRKNFGTQERIVNSKGPSIETISQKFIQGKTSTETINNYKPQQEFKVETTKALRKPVVMTRSLRIGGKRRSENENQGTRAS